MTDERAPSRSISRRTIAKGAAWAVPAVPLVIATPAYAVSGGGPTAQFLSGCKQPGSSCFNDYGFVKGYTFTIRFTNCSDKPVYIYPTLAGVDNPDAGGSATLDPVFQVTSSIDFTYETARRFTGGAIGTALAAAELIPAKVGAVCGTLDIIVNADSTNSANVPATGYLYMAWGHTVTVGGDTDHPYAPVPPQSPANLVGEGWVPIEFSIPDFPPCGTDCAPGGDATEPVPVP